ncbi:uncharacterized protein LOC124476835 isoform X3 [Hypomesus transpacificus]|nr:uncharacterized protein LOC124476835 isoform X3 [Hypomesus transpacificus]
MLGVDSGSSALASDDQMVAKALEHFCSASEQSYHQFLASFTHLSPGSGSGAASSGLPQHPAEMERSARSSRGRGGHGAADAADAADAAEGEGRLRERDCVLPVDQKEMELGRGVVVGICGHIDCCPPGTTPKLDNYLAFGDACEDMEGEDNITPVPVCDPLPVSALCPRSLLCAAIAPFPTGRRIHPGGSTIPRKHRVFGWRRVRQQVTTRIRGFAPCASAVWLWFSPNYRGKAFWDRECKCCVGFCSQKSLLVELQSRVTVNTRFPRLQSGVP